MLHLKTKDVSYLPPVLIISTDDLKDLSFLEGKAGIWTRNEFVPLRVVIEMGLEVDLKIQSWIILKSQL